MKNIDPTYDPITEEVRRIRQGIEREHGATLESFSNHLREVQAQYSDRVVDRTTPSAAGYNK